MYSTLSLKILALDYFFDIGDLSLAFFHRGARTPSPSDFCLPLKSGPKTMESQHNNKNLYNNRFCPSPEKIPGRKPAVIIHRQLVAVLLVGSMEAPSKAFLLFFLLPDWLKLNHLKSRMECGFPDIFFAPFLFLRSKNNRLDKLHSKFWREEMFRKPHLKLLR